jgi:hypothetical protein
MALNVIFVTIIFGNNDSGDSNSDGGDIDSDSNSGNSDSECGNSDSGDIKFLSL